MSKRDKSKQKIHPIELVGREPELAAVRACMMARRNVLLEGPVGVGKTHLASFVAQECKRPVFRIDGDGRYSEQKMTGWFDPPTVVKKGFTQTAFIPGPLVEAMKSGGVLLINELNRLPEGVQNVLLPAIDERILVVPKLGLIQAKPEFLVIATQNPKEFVATSHLSEAILDRFEWVSLGYQSENEEISIVESRGLELKPWALPAVRLIRLTRAHARIRRGASIRAAIAISEIADSLLKSGFHQKDAFFTAAGLALPTRIELERDLESADSDQQDLGQLLQELSQAAWSGRGADEKKKT